MSFVMPQHPSYTNAAGQPVYLVPGANLGKRNGTLPRFLVIHHTAGTDSRAYLQHNNLGVSTHYLVGLYPDTGPTPVVLKYGSETNAVAYTQGRSSIGLLHDPNIVCISIELEGPPIHPLVINEGAKLAWSIIDYWSQRGTDLLMLRHKDIDRQGKIDPDLDWYEWCQRVYGGCGDV